VNAAHEAYKIVNWYRDVPDEKSGVGQGILTIRETQLSDRIRRAIDDASSAANEDCCKIFLRAGASRSGVGVLELAEQIIPGMSDGLAATVRRMAEEIKAELSQAIEALLLELDAAPTTPPRPALPK